MRLLQLGPNNELLFTKDLVQNIPPYAILSHTWGLDDDDEVTFQDLNGNRGTEKPGYRKILFCGKQAKRDGLDYFWVDTCCIDKSNSTELAEAINSMFHWYQEARKCYVYLADVQGADDLSKSAWKLSFQKSKWFGRGWTLQELIAPSSVEFYSKEEVRLGDKKSFEREIHGITGLPIPVLHGYSLSEFSIEERISWSHNRITTRAEDRAYSLLGILGVNMSLIYGEGEKGAFERLEREIQIRQDYLGGNPKLEASLDQCLSDLRVTDPQDDKSRIESTKGGLLKNSYSWIMEHKDFQQWRSDDELNRLFWIRGDPGKGKTMLLCGIANELSIGSNGCLVSYFFCQATDANLNSAKAVVRGLIYTLIRQDRSLLKYLYEEWKVAGKGLFEDANSWDALVRIFTSMIQNARSTKLIFMIDALDECLHDLPKLLKFVAHQSNTGRAKWIVSSRNWPDIEDQLKTAEQKTWLSLELNENSVDTAVEAYIHHQVDEMQRVKNFDNTIRNEIIQYLASHATHTFLWVAIVCQRLNDPKIRRRHLLNELHRLPTGLHSLYQRMIDSVDQSLDAELCHNILGVVSAVYRPVSLAELAVLVDDPESIDNLEELEDVVRFCGSFLTIRDTVVYFIHQSAKDFLVNTAVNLIFPHGIRQKHLSISTISINALSKGLRRDMYDLREPGTSVANISSPLSNPLNPLEYSCVFWVEHLVDVEDPDKLECLEDPQMVKMIEVFFKQKYLYWLEALSLLRSKSTGAYFMAKLSHIIKIGSGLEHLARLIYDASRFIRYHGAMITQYPLQVYTTALVFSPTESLIRRLFQREEPDWLLVKPQMDKDWSACIQTLEGHTLNVTSVAFSHDGSLVASGSYDKTVRIWTADTGDLQQKYEGHTDFVHSIAFSPDGRLMASGSDDKQIRIWAADTGKLRGKLEGHTSSITSVAFSFDGRLLVSGSGEVPFENIKSTDQTIRIWSVNTEDLQQTLLGHTETVTSVAFSPDGRLVVSGSDDDTIRIWGADTVDLQRTLKGHTASVRSIAFSPDGRLLASGSDDETIRVWAADTGDLQHIIEGHDDSVSSVAFSPDSRLLASGSDDQTVRIWEVDTGNLRNTFQGHTNFVNSVAFSPNGMLVASGSNDQTVRIWAADAEGLQHTIESHTATVSSVAISPDGRLVASGSYDRAVRIWGADTGDLRQTLEGHTRMILSVEFSPDGTLVASGSYDKSVRLWSVDTGCLQRKLEGHDDPISSVAFSPDGRLVASGSYDRTVRIWVVNTGDLQKTLEGHAAYVISVTFSPDGRMVASGSYDKEVRIWMTDTGDLQQTLRGHTNFVISVAFSPDGRLVAAGSYDQTVRIWAVDTCDPQATVNIGHIPYKLGFGAGNKSIITDMGATSIQAAPDLPAVMDHHEPARSSSAAHPAQPLSLGHRAGYGISRDRCWIMLDNRNLVWLPAEYRPVESVILGTTVVIGCDSGRVLIMRFKEEETAHNHTISLEELSLQGDDAALST